jgi:F0F1-type ATP synthase membrane subunit c/vacuolar-type H+-ATPase subunit K
MNRLLLLMITLLFSAPLLLGQDATPADPDDAAAGVAGAIAALGCGVLPCILGLAIQIALAVWVYKDATKRRMDNAVLLTVLTALTGLIGLLIYILMRPKDVPPGA